VALVFDCGAPGQVDATGAELASVGHEGQLAPWHASGACATPSSAIPTEPRWSCSPGYRADSPITTVRVALLGRTVRPAAAASPGSPRAHLAALAHDSAGTPEQIMAVNVLGTWHVLLAAEAAGAQRVVCFSSAQVLGIAEGERLPDYFPVDDAHPRRAVRPYGLSKRLAEDLCEAFTARTGIATVCLRPVAVWPPARYEPVRRRWRADPRAEWQRTGSTARSSISATLPPPSAARSPCRRRVITAPCCAPLTSPALRPALTWQPGSPQAYRSPAPPAFTPNPGGHSPTAPPPLWRSAGSLPTAGQMVARSASHNTPPAA
jgi:NAD dependent epimerase/dehydratase family